MTDYVFHQGTVLIIGTTLVLLTLLLNLVYRDIPGGKLYALGSLLLQLSVLMFLSSLSRQGYIPVLIITNLGFILSVTFQLEGLSRFFGQNTHTGSVRIFSLALAIAYVYVTVIELNTTAQLIIMNFGLSFYYLKLLFMFFSKVSKNYLTSKIFFIPALVFVISILLARGLNTVLPNGWSLIEFTNQFLSEGAFFITYLFIVGFFVLAAEHQKVKLKEYNERIAYESSEKTKLLKFINHEVRNHVASISMKTELMKTNEEYEKNGELISDINLLSQISNELEHLTSDVMNKSNYRK